MITNFKYDCFHDLFAHGRIELSAPPTIRPGSFSLERKVKKIHILLNPNQFIPFPSNGFDNKYK